MGYFFLIASLILWVMFAVTGAWFYKIFPALGWKIPVVLLPILLTLFMRFTMAYTRTHYGTWESILYYAAYILAGLVFVFFSVILLFFIAWGICALLHIPAQAVLKWSSIVVLTLLTLLSVWGGFAKPKIKHISLTIPGAPAMTAAVISDAHLGTGVSLSRWKKALADIQTQQPDIIFVLGDLFEYGMNRKDYADALAAVKTPLGIYGVLGNHEYYMGYENSVRFYEQAGIKLLQNQIETLPNAVQIIGVNDIKTAHVTEKQLEQLLAKTNPAAPRILLSHQPLLTEVAAGHNIPLMLSGHTHGGQIWPFHYLVKTQFPRIYGLHEVSGMKFYITSGVFYWGIPLRFLAPAEIALVEVNP